MQIIKPQSLGLSFRPVAYRARFGLSVSGYLYVPFAQPEDGCLWGEQSMWNFLASEMEAPLIDEGIAKMTPEFLVHGKAFATSEQPQAVAVRARLGGASKTVLAFGARYWNGNTPSAPEAMQPVPLDWVHAYGGEDFAANPQGQGRAVREGVQWLPNLEYPGDRLADPDQAVAPAAFAPLDIMHPQRMALSGTYDDAWRKECAPGYPDDLEWQYFNMASRDQWLDAPLRGDETYELHHMHPQQPHMEGRLPGLCVRAFARYRSSAAQDENQPMKLREVPMRLTTVWFFPAAERMVLVFHGLAETRQADGSDIHGLLGAVERIAPAVARPAEHYLDVLEKRTQGPDAILETLNDADLLPEGLDTTDPSVEEAQARLKSDELREDAQYRRAQMDVEMARDLLRSRGKDPDALGVRLAPREKPPTAAEMPVYLKKLREQMEEQRWLALDAAVTQVEAALEFCKKNKTDLSQLAHRGPPTYRADEQLAELAQAHRKAGRPFDRERLGADFKRMELVHHANYLQTAHLQPPVAPLTGEAAAESHREAVFLLQRGIRSWPRIDFTGADLSNLDLRGADLTGAWLESANLRNTNLSGAKLNAAVLAHADLRGVTAIGAEFQVANLGGAQCAQAAFEDADFQGAVLGGTQLGGANLRAAQLTQAQLLDSVWSGARAAEIVAPGVLFYKLDMAGVHFSGANLSGCQFIECGLEGADFSGANLGSAGFIDSDASKARFVGARLAGAVFVKTTLLSGADFSGADLSNANLGECDLTGVCFARANLSAAFLGSSRMVDCDLRSVNAKGALLSKAVLQRARLTGANFHDAILQSADLRSASLRNASFFGADLSRIRLDRAVKTDGVVLERARLYPRLTPEEHARED